MARGKIKIKKIENVTNRQVTYSKRRNGLFKKANELVVLCDATVSIVMISSSNKLHEFLSPGATTKAIYDRYQKAAEVDLWAKQYQKMQDELENLNEISRGLQKDIRQRIGDCLDDLSFPKLVCLLQEMEESVMNIRERKYKKIDSSIDTAKKKVRNANDLSKSLLQNFALLPKEEPHYGLLINGEYNHVLGYNNELSMLALRLALPTEPLKEEPHYGSVDNGEYNHVL